VTDLVRAFQTPRDPASHVRPSTLDPSCEIQSSDWQPLLLYYKLLDRHLLPAMLDANPHIRNDDEKQNPASSAQFAERSTCEVY
jgi:hypothetical protein